MNHWADPLAEPFSPPRWLAGLHCQSMLPSLPPRRWRLEAKARHWQARSHSEVLRLSDGVRLLCEWDEPVESSPSSSSSLHSSLAHSPSHHSPSPVAILLHGWEGSSRSVHTLSLATVLLAQGIRTVRLNLRDHGNSHHLNRDLFHSCRLQEVVDALGVIVKRVAPAPCVAVGFSLGGSFVLRAACDAHIGMKAAIAICPPLNPAQSMVQLQTGSLVYKHYFLRKWNRSLAIKRAAWPEVYNEQNLPQGQNLTDMTENLVARYTDYPSVADYFKGYAIIGERLQDLQIPATLVLAEDDPIIPIADSDRLPLHPQLRVIKQRRGGHCGFLEHLNGEAWIDGRVAKAILNVTRSS